MYQATRKINDALNRVNGLKVFTEEKGDSSIVWVQFNAEGGGPYRINFISKDNDNDVAVRIWGLQNVSGEQKARVILLLNDLNKEYRFFRFLIDDDGDVNVEYDFFVDEVDPAACAKETVVRLVKIIDEIYPRLMRTIWGQSR